MPALRNDTTENTKYNVTVSKHWLKGTAWDKMPRNCVFTLPKERVSFFSIGLFKVSQAVCYGGHM